MKSNLKALWRGFLRMLTGSFVAGLFILSGVSFWMIPAKAGYEAAVLCLIGIALLICGVVSMYALGGGRKQAPTGKYSK